MDKKTITLFMLALLSVIGAKADVIPSKYYSEKGEGTFYIYDVTSQKFISRENNRIAFESEPTKTFTLTLGENGRYTIRYDATTTYMMWNNAGQGQSWGADFWMDANGYKNTGQYALWDLTPAGTKTYKISSSCSYYGTDEKTGGTAKYLNGSIWSTESADVAHEYAFIKASTKLIPSSYFSAPAEGTFYLYNVKQGKFLDRLNNNFPTLQENNTPAAFTMATSSIGYTITYTSNTSYKLHTGYWNNQYLWVDAGNATSYYDWMFASIEGLTNTYMLKRTGEETQNDNTGTFYVNGTNAWTSSNEDCLWALITTADYTNWQNSFNLSDEDWIGFGSVGNIYNVNPTVNRAMTVNAWNTLVVPFDMAIPSGWTVKEPSSFENGTLNFKDANSIEAGKPYIVKPTEAVTNFSATGVTLKKDLNPTSVSDGALTMTGTYTLINEVPQGSYVLGNDNKLYKVDSTVGLKPFRAYFTITSSESSAKVINVNFDDVPTVINSVNNDELKNNVYYNLSGQRVMNPTKGIYIVNGKKVYIK